MRAEKGDRMRCGDRPNSTIEPLPGRWGQIDALSFSILFATLRGAPSIPQWAEIDAREAAGRVSKTKDHLKGIAKNRVGL